MKQYRKHAKLDIANQEVFVGITRQEMVGSVGFTRMNAPTWTEERAGSYRHSHEGVLPGFYDTSGSAHFAGVDKPGEPF